MSLLFWNCQGAASPSLRSLSFMISNNHANFVVPFEIHISGTKADSVIKKLGFPRSHRVEAKRFLGWNLDLWNNDCNV